VCRWTTLGDRIFPVAETRAWNGLPSTLKASTSLATFSKLSYFKPVSTDSLTKHLWLCKVPLQRFIMLSVTTISSRLTNGQSNLITGRIAAERGRQVAPVPSPPYTWFLAPTTVQMLNDHFTRFCTAHGSVLIFYNELPFLPQNCPFPWEHGPSSNTWFLGTIWAHNPNGISIGSAVFAGLTSVTDRQTDQQTTLLSR